MNSFYSTSGKTKAMESVTQIGLSLKESHLSEIVNAKHPVQHFELMADNWLAEGGFVDAALQGVAESYSITLHGVGLSLGSVDPLDKTYLRQVKNLLERSNTRWYSEHCSFSSFRGNRVPDLLPLPYTKDALLHLVDKITQVQDFLNQNILIENISSYVEYESNEFSEAEFLKLLVEKSGCYLLLDLNNVYVSCHNHGWDMLSYLENVPPNSIKEIHLGGFHEDNGILIDSHSSEPSQQVWEWYCYYMNTYRPEALTIIEWDNQVPSFQVMLQQWHKAQSLLSNKYSKKDLVC